MTYCSILVLLLVLLSPPLIVAIEQKTFDARIKITAKKEEADTRIKIIDIDQASLDFLHDEYGLTWPIPRELYGILIDFLKQGSIRGLAFDLLFTESSVHGLDSDKTFAESISSDLPVVNAVTIHRYDRSVDPEKLQLFSDRQKTRNRVSKFGKRCLLGGSKNSFRSFTLPIIELLRSESYFGSVHASPDADGVFRRHSPGELVDGIPLLSLPFALADATLDSEQLCAAITKTASSSLIVRPHGGRDTYERISLATVLQAAAQGADSNEGRQLLTRLADSWIFVGASAPGLFDLRPTALEPRGIGVQYLATVFDNALHDDFLRPSSRLEVFIASFILILASTAIILLAEDIRKQLVGFVLLVGLYEALTFLLFDRGYVLAQVIPLGSGMVAAVLSLALQYQLVGREHRFIKRAFQHYVSPALVKQLVASPERLSLGGEKRQVSIFFSDIVGFTSISERIDAATLASLLNEYLTLMTDTIHNHGGTVDKFVGDAVIAFWNAPLEDTSHALHAVEAALACQRKLLEHQQIFTKRYGVFPKTRIGINTGTVNVGNFGSKSRFNYTVIGDEVNLASRLEGANKQFGTAILVSEHTVALIDSLVSFRKIGFVRVLGKANSILVYEPLDDELHAQTKAGLTLYNKAYAAFHERNLQGARSVFQEIDQDPVARAYLERLEQEMSTPLEVFDPVWILVEK